MVYCTVWKYGIRCKISQEKYGTYRIFTVRSSPEEQARDSSTSQWQPCVVHFPESCACFCLHVGFSSSLHASYTCAHTPIWNGHSKSCVQTTKRTFLSSRHAWIFSVWATARTVCEHLMSTYYDRAMSLMRISWRHAHFDACVQTGKAPQENQAFLHESWVFACILLHLILAWWIGSHNSNMHVYDSAASHRMKIKLFASPNMQYRRIH